MLYLGVDLGGTNIKAALVNSEGEIYVKPASPQTCRARRKLSAMTLQRCACSWRKGKTLQVLVSGVRELWTVELCCIPTIWTGMILQWKNIWLKRQGCRLLLAMMQMLPHWARFCGLR